MSLASPHRALKSKRVNDLFFQFSWPLLHACVTDHQQEMALELAKMLWFRLVTGTDTEETIAQDLKIVFPDNQASIAAFGSLYFFKMKPALKESTIRELKQHFARQENLKNVGDARLDDVSVMRA
ncbi:MAG: hypothetical protein JZU52_21895 [Lamprocystis purpurea]|jgi:hypothetical protein|uniref:hypothetical protein n=1 Tax=Lamprocystis purpurea TaxID=61598 RepID=UPI00036F6CBD|nr:hypothetical protein [Lamprocystis purpurea]MBV5276173.1 hypothetical protein [Lamprocystis purpurea]